jgi:hypothetical protein
MPLNAGALSSGLSSCFSNPPPSAGACASQWASAVQSWAAGIVPASTTVSAAVSTLEGALAAAFATPNCAPALESAFAAFAVTVGGGMVGYAPTPPPAPVGFAPQFAGAKPPTAGAAASAIAGLIEPWMKTGIGTLIAPPNTPQPWS